MRCPRCGFDSPVATPFCGGCGSRLTIACGACGASNPAAFSYCGACGSPLAENSASSGLAASSKAGAPPAAERRQLTVMFCDLVGSTSLSALLDPEELRDLIRAYQAAAARVIERYDGYVAQYLGDGILAYFGFPRALENEAGRAVRAGRELIAEIRLLNERIERPEAISLAARVGIHTGVVVVGEIGGGARREHLALGETPNVAARIQAVADPDEVVLSGETERLVRGEFLCRSLGRRAIRGLAQEVEVFRAEDELHGAEAVPGATAPVHLVGREAELQHLAEAWNRATSGAGEAILLGGEAGMGKSALARAAAARAAATGGRVLQARCLPYYHTSPLQPVAELLRRWSAATGAEEAPRDRLQRLLAHHRLEPALPLFAALLGLRRPEREATSPPPEPQWRDRTAQAVVELLLRASSDAPCLIFFEDVHWADPSTLELLARLIPRLSETRILLVLTHRPGFQPPWEASPHQSELVLHGLTPDESHELMAAITGRLRLPEAVAARIVERTDGVPLFVEELTRSVLESGLLRSGESGYELTAEELPPLAIPLTLHDSLEARLERLSSTRELAQLGAALGREFSHELIRAVADLDAETLAASLDRLVEADLLVRTSSGDSAMYAFKHALIQDVAYQSMVRGDRQRHHLRIARALEADPAEAEQHPELIAQHFAAAGLPRHAVELWTRAGRRAVERSANREAIAHLQQGLAALAKLPDNAERQARELELHLTLAPALIATHGHAADEVREVFERARACAEGVADSEQRFEVLTGLATTCFVRLEMLEAQRAAREMLQLACAEQNQGRAAASRIALGSALVGGGEIESGLASLEEGIRDYRPERDFPLAHAAGQDFGVLGMAYSAYALCALGRPERAWRRAQEAIALARSLDHPHTLALALSFAGSVAYFLRTPTVAAEPLDELAELARRERFQHWLAGATPLQAWAMANREESERAVALLQHAGVGADVTPERLDVQVVFWRLLAGDVYLVAGRPGDALHLLEEVVGAIESRSIRLWWLSEARRLRAAALAALDRGAEAADELARAIAEAAATGALLFELRARLDRAALRGVEDAADPGLEEIEALVAAFTEGGELEDLRRARALLARTRPTPRPR